MTRLIYIRHTSAGHSYGQCWYHTSHSLPTDLSMYSNSANLMAAVILVWRMKTILCNGWTFKDSCHVEIWLCGIQYQWEILIKIQEISGSVLVHGNRHLYSPSCGICNKLTVVFDFGFCATRTHCNHTVVLKCKCNHLAWLACWKYLQRKHASIYLIRIQLCTWVSGFLPIAEGLFVVWL